ncbi:MAG TPA: LamG-like jellyroll fold domain-containing protein [Planctomycetota bacterium]|nr:LamG-like jellyroll fold domain-containing protein [Planctomycetota bacterium]
MDKDLETLLGAWVGDGPPPEDAPALLGRLRSDGAFRAAFAEEVALLGRLRAVQSTEPRWLRLEDELGAARPEHDLEAGVMEALAPRRRNPGRVAAAAVLVLGLGALLWAVSRPASPPAGPPLAAAVELDAVEWEPGPGQRPSRGGVVGRGLLRLRSGYLGLAFFSGVHVHVEGPAEIELRSADRLHCVRGRLRVRAAEEGAGFQVSAPGALLVDLGTEFGVNVGADGQSDAYVFEGKVEISALAANGASLRSELVRDRRAVTIDARDRRIRESAAAPEAFVAARPIQAPPLALRPSYAQAVLASAPAGYWRFEEAPGDEVPNEIAGGPSLRRTGSVPLEGDGNRSAVFRPSAEPQHFVLSEPWTIAPQGDYALELWMASDMARHATAVGLIVRDGVPGADHLLVLETSSVSSFLAHPPGALRYLHRWPPGGSGGVNLFSRSLAPARWYHCVAQKRGSRMELYVDGERAGDAALDSADAGSVYDVVLGQLRPVVPITVGKARPFVGRLDELAIYGRALDPDEIRRHVQAR